MNTQKGNVLVVFVVLVALVIGIMYVTQSNPISENGQNLINMLDCTVALCK